jgi:hypothetical protein
LLTGIFTGFTGSALRGQIQAAVCRVLTTAISKSRPTCLPRDTQKGKCGAGNKGISAAAGKRESGDSGKLGQDYARYLFDPNGSIDACKDPMDILTEQKAVLFSFVVRDLLRDNQNPILSAKIKTGV